MAAVQDSCRAAAAVRGEAHAQPAVGDARSGQAERSFQAVACDERQGTGHARVAHHSDGQQPDGAVWPRDEG